VIQNINYYIINIIMNLNNSDDPFYRYKRPNFEVEYIKGKRQTIIKNIDQLSKKIDRDQSLLAKYFAKSFSTSAKINKKQFLEINAIVSIEKLDESLQNFIDRYILCPSCDNPETTISQKNDNIVFNCSACGGITILNITTKYDQIVYNNL
jgi:translation initiation factor 5